MFPFHHVGFAGNGRKPHLWGIDFNRPMGTYSYKRAFNTARKERPSGLPALRCAAHVSSHDSAENPAISEETIRQLAGHVSPRMLARYAHIRAHARRDAIATLEPKDGADEPEFRADGPQNAAQSDGQRQPLLELKVSQVFEFTVDFGWSGRPDLNRRPHAPQACALPGCATPRPEELRSHRCGPPVCSPAARAAKVRAPRQYSRAQV